MVVYVLVNAFSSLGRGHRLATVLARVPPKSLPSPHSGQRLSEHQTSPRCGDPRGEPKCSSSQNSKVPLEKHHPCRVSVLTMSAIVVTLVHIQETLRRCPRVCLFHVFCLIWDCYVWSSSIVYVTVFTHFRQYPFMKCWKQCPHVVNTTLKFNESFKNCPC